MTDEYLSEEQFIEACRHIYREAKRLRETHNNGGPGADELASYIASFWAEVTRNAGICAAFTHEYFADARDGDRDALPEQAADAYRAAGPEGDFRAAAKFFLRFGSGFLPAAEALRMGQIMAGISERQMPPQLREILDRTPGHRYSDQSFRSIAVVTIAAAKYLRGLAPVKYRSWLDAHIQILPSDISGYPTDDTRQEWHDGFTTPELRAVFETAGKARREAGEGAEISADLAEHEATARSWIVRGPAKTREVFDLIKRDATEREGREVPVKSAKKRRTPKKPR